MTILQSFVQFLDYLWPKDDRIWIFGSNNGRKIDGNPKALYDRLSSDPSLRCFYITRDHRPGYHTLPFKSLRPLFLFLRARYLVISHGLWDTGFLKPSREKKIIETWHGIPVKPIGFSIINPTIDYCKMLKEHAKIIDSFLVSSEYVAQIFNESLHINPRKFLLTGQPRNDLLIQKKARTPISTLIDLPEADSRIVLYAPTFRDSGANPFFNFPDFDLSGLIDFLNENNITLLLRPHISDSSNVQPFLNERIKLFSSEQCPEMNESLADIDLLITDYSSIFIDYLLLDRPILFTCTDFRQYTLTERGQLLVDDYPNWIPGPDVRTQEILLQELKKALIQKEDRWQKRRKDLRILYHSHQTGDTVGKLYEHYHWRNENHPGHK